VNSAYLWLKWLHIVSSTVLLGTGAGIAFFFVRAQRTGDVRVLAAVARDVVFADFVFTAVAVVVQPVTGLLMMHMAGYPLSLPWIRTSLVLFAAVGCCWLPVVWLQLRLRDMAVAAAAAGGPLPPVYNRYYRWWVALGWPAFAGVLATVWVMVVKRGF
jgi:uncharacterized membrane protein